MDDLNKTWKEKNLDYEIETKFPVCATAVVPSAWKEKNLDYEIETLTQCVSPGHLSAF